MRNVLANGPLPPLMDRTDKALLAAFLLVAVLGTWMQCLMHEDGAIIIAAAWLGNFWDLYASQIPDRTIAVLVQHGPAWLARVLFGLRAGTYVTVAHVLYFAVPLGLWLVLRAVEPQRLFSRLYLAVILPMVYFPSELVFGIGVWMIWLALVSEPTRSNRSVAVATLLLGAVMALSHPALALMGLLFVAAGLALPLAGQRLPARILLAVGLLSLGLLAAWFAMFEWLLAPNPTDGASLATNRLAYINPLWILKTVSYFPMLIVLWFLLLVPAVGLLAPRAQGRFLSIIILAFAAVGFWLALAGTDLKMSIWARYTAIYTLVLVLVLGLPAPASWLRAAARPIMLFSAITAVSAISLNIDVWLFGRFIDRELRPGVTDAKTVADSWPSTMPQSKALRVLFKYGAGRDYVRDVVMPIYDFSRVPLAFYSFFRSDRHSVLFHPLGGGANWRPFRCPAISRALEHARDAPDRMFLEFVGQQYCTP